MARSPRHAMPDRPQGRNANLPFLAGLFAMLASAPKMLGDGDKALAAEVIAYEDDESAVGGIAGIISIVLVIVVAVVAIAVIAALAPTYLTSISDITQVFTSGNYTTGDDTADSLMPVFGLLIAFLGLFALLGLVFVAVKLRGGGSA